MSYEENRISDLIEGGLIQKHEEQQKSVYKISRRLQTKEYLLDERIRLLQCLYRAIDLYGKEHVHVKNLRKLISENKKVSKKF